MIINNRRGRETGKMFLRKFARPTIMMTTMKMSSEAAKDSSTAIKSGPVPELIKIYERTIKDIQSIPEEEGYRKALEATTRERLDICIEEEDPEAIEKRIGCGKVEELVQDAKFEFKILSNLLEWDPWGTNEAYVSDIINQFDQVTKAEPPGLIPDELYERLKDLAKATCEKDELKTRGGSEEGNSEDPYSSEPDDK